MMTTTESSFMSLPRELVIEVLGRVAASSSIDLYNAKLCCKELSEVAEEDSIHKQISLEKFPVVQWRKNHQILEFLRRCERSRNPEALFRKGVVDYFGGKDINNAIKCLEDASKSGHAEASYAMAVILVLGGGKLKQKGITLLSQIKKSRIQDCRKRLQSILKMIWIKNSLILRQRPTCCTIHQRKRRRRRSNWDHEEICEDDNIFCDDCICDEEIVPICDALPQIIH